MLAPFLASPLFHTREINLRDTEGVGGRREAPPNLSLNPEARRHYVLCLRLCHYILTAQVPPPALQRPVVFGGVGQWVVVRPADTNAHFGSERLHRAEQHVRGKMYAHAWASSRCPRCVCWQPLFSLWRLRALLSLPLPRCRRGRVCSVRECVSSSTGYLCFDTKQLIPSEIHARRERSP